MITKAAVHPHVHGERSYQSHRLAPVCGSSPRTWGTLYDHMGYALYGRFIPTYMGNAPGETPATAQTAVHPHVHGERCRCRSTTTNTTGSSPRTWGTRCLRDDRVLHHRFIPTYMGNAHTCTRSPFTRTVHPHVHGERYPAASSGIRWHGSSPRTWGTHGSCRLCDRGDRFIPTYMGNASMSPMTSSPGSVHPHVHGERVFATAPGYSQIGSSPRTWGTPYRGLQPLRRSRFIPTYMGNATGFPGKIINIPVHPHVHGERLLGWPRPRRASGSSPRTWGTRYG